LDAGSGSDAGSSPSSPKKKGGAGLMKTITGMFKGKPTTSPLASPESTEELVSAAIPERKSRSTDTSAKYSRSVSAKPLQNGGSTKNGGSSRRHPKSFRTGSLTIRATHPSTPPVPLSRKISLSAVKQNGNSNSSELSSGGDSAEEDGDTSSSTAPATSSVENSNLNQKTSSTLAGSKRAVAAPQAQGSGSLSRLPPELVDRLVRRSRKSSSKHYKAAHLKRVRKANEIQRQLEEIDVKHRELEERGIIAEKSLRGEDIDDDNMVALDSLDLAASNGLNGTSRNSYDPVTMKAWFKLLAEKNQLIRQEQELLVQAKLLELDDNSAKMEVELRSHLSGDTPTNTAKAMARESELLRDLLEVCEQRDQLQSMLAKDKARYQKEDAQVEAQMQAKILTVTQ